MYCQRSFLDKENQIFPDTHTPQLSVSQTQEELKKQNCKTNNKSKQETTGHDF